MPRVSNREVQESRMRVLVFLGERTRGQKCPVSLSYRVISQTTGLSRVQVRSICGYLEQKGLCGASPRSPRTAGSARTASRSPRGAGSACASTSRSYDGGEASACMPPRGVRTGPRAAARGSVPLRGPSQRPRSGGAGRRGSVHGAPLRRGARGARCRGAFGGGHRSERACSAVGQRRGTRPGGDVRAPIAGLFAVRRRRLPARPVCRAPRVERILAISIPGAVPGRGCRLRRGFCRARLWRHASRARSLPPRLVSP